MEIWAIGLFLVLAGVLIAGYQWAHSDDEGSETSSSEMQNPEQEMSSNKDIKQVGEHRKAA